MFKVFLLITAPAIFLLIIGFSLWLAWEMSTKSRKRSNIAPLAAFAAGLVACAFSALLIQLGQLNIPIPNITLPFICVFGVIGIGVGLSYLWLAKLFLENSVSASLFILGSVAGSSVSLYFFTFYSEVQEILISGAWGYLLGVLLYMVFFGSKDGEAGIQGAFREIIRNAKRR